MSKKIIVATLFFLTIIAFGSLFQQNRARETFEMKSKCVTYKNNIEKELAKTSWSSYVVDEIFYSPINNSCYYAVIAQQNNRLDPYTAYIIWDYLTTEMPFYRDTSLTNGQNISDIYHNAKNYLKGTGKLNFSNKDWNLSQQ